jgi:hypothetical protein
MTDTKDERIAELERERDDVLTDYGRLSRDFVKENEARVTAERRADALERELRKARPLVEKWCHYQGDHPALFKQYLGPIDAALAKQEPGQPAQEWTAERAQAYIDQFDQGQPAHLTGHGEFTPVIIRSRTITDQPAQDGEPSVDQARFERVWQQLVYSLADFFALEATDAQARSIAREVLQAADAGEADEWECSMCGETMAREATWGDCGHEHCPMLPSEMEADAAIRRTGDTGGGDE